MSRKILLADDSVTIRKVVELTFMEEDYELTAVGDGREALPKLDEMVPDLVIADVHMGEVGGFEVCEEAKKKYPDVPVLLLVGTFEPFDRADVEKYGADAFLKKPFDSQLSRSPCLTKPTTKAGLPTAPRKASPTPTWIGLPAGSSNSCRTELCGK
jgi:CheY-like chemotaxis protein